MFGYIELSLGYKFVNWILFGLSGLVTFLLVVFAKETRCTWIISPGYNLHLSLFIEASVLLIRKAKRLRRETGNQNYRSKAEEERSSLHKLIAISLTRPVRLLCREPVLLSFTVRTPLEFLTANVIMLTLLTLFALVMDDIRVCT